MAQTNFEGTKLIELAGLLNETNYLQIKAELQRRAALYDESEAYNKGGGYNCGDPEPLQNGRPGDRQPSGNPLPPGGFVGGMVAGT